MKEHVILLHGLARSYRSMTKLASMLEKSGYTVTNCQYPSTHLNIEEAAEETISEALNTSNNSAKIHFVTHSLGGLLLRSYLRHHSISNLGRVVMLAPPNRGSEIADWLRVYGLFQRLIGPALNQLGTQPLDFPNQLGTANFELGVIAGTRALNPIFYFLLARPNDGTVSAENTKLEGMRDHICLPASHPLIMKNANVIRQVLQFLKQGQFER